MEVSPHDGMRVDGGNGGGRSAAAVDLLKAAAHAASGSSGLANKDQPTTADYSANRSLQEQVQQMQHVLHAQQQLQQQQSKQVFAGLNDLGGGSAGLQAAVAARLAGLQAANLAAANGAASAAASPRNGDTTAPSGEAAARSDGEPNGNAQERGAAEAVAAPPVGGSPVRGSAGATSAGNGTGGEDWVGGELVAALLAPRLPLAALGLSHATVEGMPKQTFLALLRHVGLNLQAHRREAAAAMAGLMAGGSGLTPEQEAMLETARMSPAPAASNGAAAKPPGFGEADGGRSQASGDSKAEEAAQQATDAPGVAGDQGAKSRSAAAAATSGSEDGRAPSGSKEREGSVPAAESSGGAAAGAKADAAAECNGGSAQAGGLSASFLVGSLVPKGRRSKGARRRAGPERIGTILRELYQPTAREVRENEAATNNASANGSDRRQFGELMALRRAKDAAASGNPLSPEQSQLLAAISAAGGHKAAVTAVLAGNGASIFGPPVGSCQLHAVVFPFMG
eukprot:XP_001699288.1 predicted protein [Chlamydomonas reinhardtii]